MSFLSILRVEGRTASSTPNIYCRNLIDSINNPAKKVQINEKSLVDISASWWASRAVSCPGL